MRTHVAVLLVLTCYASQSFAQRKHGGRVAGGAAKGKSDMVLNMVSRECKTVGMSEPGIVILKKSLTIQQQETAKPAMTPEAMEKLQNRVKDLCKKDGMTDPDLAFWDTCCENLKTKFGGRRGLGKKDEKKDEKKEEKKDEEKKEEDKKDEEKKDE